MVPCLPGFAQGDRPLSPRFDPAKFWKSSDLKAGMKGYGLTVFQGVKIERFEVEILGVLHNEYSETDLILARCSGGPLEKTGVIAGMSGSPIFIDEKQIGALAYAWAYSTDAIAGITPIQNMLPVLDMPATERSGSAAAGLEGDGVNSPGRELPGGTNSTPDDWSDRLMSFLNKDYSSALFGNVQATERQPATQERVEGWNAGWVSWFQAPLASPAKMSTGPGWIPLSTPISMGGISSGLQDKVAGLMSGIGFQPVAGGGPSGQEKVEVKLEPGSALGVAMVTGDLNMTGIGTVTYQDGNHILGFGHPMFQDGSTDLPMTTAYINTVLPSSRLSTKMGGLVSVVGVLEQDRLPAIGGVVGGKATTVPMRVHIRNQVAGLDREFHYELSQHRFFTSRFGMICILDSFDVATRGFRDSASDFTLTLKLKDHPAVVVKDHISSTMGTSFEIAMTLGAALDLLLQNPYEKVFVEGIDLEVEAVDRLRRGTIDSIRVENQTIEQGEPVVVNVAVRPWLGETKIIRHTLPLPRDVQPGPMQLQVTDAIGYITELQRHNPDRFRSRSLKNLIDLMNDIYRNDQLFLTLSALAPGASFNGKEMADLPTSVLRVMADSPERGTGLFLMNQPIAADRIQVGTPLVGSHAILVQVEPRRAEPID
jgi:hypothetical protein